MNITRQNTSIPGIVEQMLGQAKQMTTQDERYTERLSFKQLFTEKRSNHGLTESVAIEEATNQNASQKRSSSSMVNHHERLPAITRKGLDGGVAQVLEQAANKQDTMDELVQMVLSKDDLSNRELLVMQVGVYRCTHELELMSKVVEKGTSAIKETMNTPV